MKRFLASLLCVALLATFVFIPASAATIRATVTAGQVNAECGQNIEVPINVALSGVGALTFEVSYNPDVLINASTKEKPSLGYSEGGVFNQDGTMTVVNAFTYNKAYNPQAAESKVLVTLINSSGLTATGTLLSLKFTVKDNVADGNYPLEVTISTASNEEAIVFAPDEVKAVNGAVVVAHTPAKSGIIVKTAPTKTEYKIGEAFNPDGLVIEQTWTEGKANTVVDPSDYDLVYDPDMIRSSGQKTITVEQISADFSTSFNVNYSDYIQAISVVSRGKDEYKVGEPLDTTGAVINAVWVEKSPEVIDHSDLEFGSVDITTPGEKNVTVNQISTGLSTYYTVNYSNYPTGIYIASIPTKNIYKVGESLDTAGLVIEQVWASGDNTALTPSDYTLSTFDNTTPGTKTITVTQNETEFTASFDVTYADYATGIIIAKLPDVTTFKINSGIDLTGLVVEQTWAYGENTTVTGADYTYSPVDDSIPGTKTVTITQISTGFTATFEVTYVDYEIAITVTKAPDKVEYEIGEAFDPAGIEVTVSWAYGADTTADIANLSFAGFDSETAGTKTVSVTLNGTSFSDKFDVEVLAPQKIEPSEESDVVVDEDKGLLVNIASNDGTGEGGKKLVKDIIAQLKNGQNIKVFDKTGEVELNADDVLFTNAVVKLYKNDEVVDSKVVVIAGDCDGNGSVDAADALRDLQISIEKIKLDDVTVAEQIAAKVDASTVGITAADALRILQFSIGKIDDLRK